jgi:hypothetical protein
MASDTLHANTQNARERDNGGIAAEVVEGQPETLSCLARKQGKQLAPIMQIELIWKIELWRENRNLPLALSNHPFPRCHISVRQGQAEADTMALVRPAVDRSWLMIEITTRSFDRLRAPKNLHLFISKSLFCRVRLEWNLLEAST